MKWKPPRSPGGCLLSGPQATVPGRRGRLSCPPSRLLPPSSARWRGCTFREANLEATCAEMAGDSQELDES